MTYRQLLGELDEWFARGVVDAGHDIVLCRRGCSACCNGPFDISPADAQLVAAAVEQLDPSVRSHVQLQAINHTARYFDIDPEWAVPWAIDDNGEGRFDRVSDRLASLPCPALGDDGSCVIYDARPANCRVIGLALITPDGGILDNACPILHTSHEYAELNPTLFDLERFERSADDHDVAASNDGWVRTTVAGAIARKTRE